MSSSSVYAVVAILLSVLFESILRRASMIVVVCCLVLGLGCGTFGLYWHIFLSGLNEIFSPSFLWPPGLGLTIGASVIVLSHRYSSESPASVEPLIGR